jgi:hypothetical protein
MSRGRVAAIALACAAFCSTQAQAGNGSNYIHLMNGVEYAFSPLPLVDQTQNFFNGIWRCFPADMTHAPSLVKNPNEPLFGTYSLKVNTVHINAGGNKPIFDFPNVVLSSNYGDCRFLTTAVAQQINFAPVNFTGIPAALNLAVIGPMNDPAPTPNPLQDINVHFLVGGVQIASAGPGLAQLLFVNVFNIFQGTSAIPVSEKENVTLWVRESHSQSVPGGVQYWMFSGDERMVCTAQSSSFLAFQSAAGPITVGQLRATAGATIGGLEWGIGLGVEDATTNAVVNSIQNGVAGGGGIPNANSDVTWPPAGPGMNPPGGFDAGQASRKISLSGTSLHASSSLGGETLGFASYDELNHHITNLGHTANGRIVLMELYQADPVAFGTITAPDCHDRSMITPAPGSFSNGPLVVLSGLSGSRIVGDFFPAGGAPPDPQQGPYPSGSAFTVFAPAFVASAGWLVVTSHDTLVGGIDLPYLPLPTLLVSGATGRSNVGTGTDFPLPPPASVTVPFAAGLKMLAYSWPLNGAMPFSATPIPPLATSLAPAANNGHSLSMGYTITFWP